MVGASNDERLTLLRKGDYLFKLGHNLSNSDRLFQLSENDASLRYISNSKTVEVPLVNIRSIDPGRRSKGFLDYDKKKKYKEEERQALALVSFSIHYDVPTKKGVDTFNITCKGNPAENISAQQQFDLWFNGLRLAIGNARVAEGSGGGAVGVRCSTQLVPRLPGTTTTQLFGGGKDSAADKHSSTTPLFGGKPRPANLQIPGVDQRCASDSSPRACRQDSFISNTLSNPTTSNGPPSVRRGGVSSLGDPFFVGSPVAGTRHRRAGAKDNSHVVARIPGSSVLDAAQAAVSDTHALLVTRGGDVYSWGGVGCEDEAHVRRLDGLAGQRCREVACGRGASLALSEQGTVFSWGDGSLGTLGHGSCEPVFSPKPIRRFAMSARSSVSSSSVSVKHIAAGPYHCAAVSGGLQLFTWGDGAHGRLGHGDMDPWLEPRHVEALASCRVLRVSCGTYHTAAVCINFAECAYDPTSRDSGDPSESLFGPASTPQSSRKVHCGQLYTWGGAFAAPSSATGCVPAAALKTGAAANSDAMSTLMTSATSQLSPADSASSRSLPSPSAASSPRYQTAALAPKYADNTSDNQGCLGQAEVPKNRGLLVPQPVDLHFVCDCACGENFTLAVDTHGRVFQMGSMGVAAGQAAPWEGARTPTQVGGALATTFVTYVAAGAHHAVALGCKRTPSDDEVATQAYSWGNNSAGQLGRVSVSDRGPDSSAIPTALPLAAAPLFAAAAGPHTSVLVVKHGCVHPETPSQKAPRSRILNLAIGPRPPKDGSAAGRDRPPPSSRRVSSQDASMWASIARRPSAQNVALMELQQSFKALSRPSAAPKHTSSSLSAGLGASKGSNSSFRRRSDASGAGGVIQMSSEPAMTHSPSTRSSLPGADSIPTASKQSSLATDGIDWESLDVDATQSNRPPRPSRLSSPSVEREYASRNKALESALAAQSVQVAKLQSLLREAQSRRSTDERTSQSRSSSFAAADTSGNGGDGHRARPSNQTLPEWPPAAPYAAVAASNSMPALRPSGIEWARQTSASTLGEAASQGWGASMRGGARDSNGSFALPESTSSQVAQLTEMLVLERQARQAAETQVQSLHALLTRAGGRSPSPEPPLTRALRGPGPYTVDSYRWPVDEGVYAEVDVHELQTVSRLEFSPDAFDAERVQKWWEANKTRIAVGELLRGPPPGCTAKSVLVVSTGAAPLPLDPRAPAAAKPARPLGETEMGDLYSPTDHSRRSLTVRSTAFQSLEALEEGTDSRDSSTPIALDSHALTSSNSVTADTATPTPARGPSPAAAAARGGALAFSFPLELLGTDGLFTDDSALAGVAADKPEADAEAADALVLHGLPRILSDALQTPTPPRPRPSASRAEASTDTPPSGPPLLDGGDSPTRARSAQALLHGMGALDGSVLVPVSGA